MALIDRLRAAHNRPPDQVIGNPSDPQLYRWWIIPRNRFFNIYLHRFLRSDSDVPHDHPWWNASFLIKGEYTEHTIDADGTHRCIVREAGQIKFRSARGRHRIELHAGECWTLFFTGPKVREWGFWCGNRWVHSKEFTRPTSGGNEVGKGCGD